MNTQKVDIVRNVCKSRTVSNLLWNLDQVTPLINNGFEYIESQSTFDDEVIFVIDSGLIAFIYNLMEWIVNYIMILIAGIVANIIANNPSFDFNDITQRLLQYAVLLFMILMIN